MVAMLSAPGDLPAELAFCLATGNTARQRRLDAGLLAVGMAADPRLMDRAQHAPGAGLLESVAQGNLPGVGMVLIDGTIACRRSRNTPPATRIPQVVTGEARPPKGSRRAGASSPARRHCHGSMARSR